MGMIVASVRHCPTVPDWARSAGAVDDRARSSPTRPTPARAVQPQPSGAASVRMNPPFGGRGRAYVEPRHAYGVGVNLRGVTGFLPRRREKVPKRESFGREPFVSGSGIRAAGSAPPSPAFAAIAATARQAASYGATGSVGFD